jgi:hypothetical protein
MFKDCGIKKSLRRWERSFYGLLVPGCRGKRNEHNICRIGQHNKLLYMICNVRGHHSVALSTPISSISQKYNFVLNDVV